MFGTNEAFDPKTDIEEIPAPMVIPRHGLHGAICAAIGNLVHAPGGDPVPGAYHDAFTFEQAAAIAASWHDCDLILH